MNIHLRRAAVVAALAALLAAVPATVHAGTDRAGDARRDVVAIAPDPGPRPGNKAADIVRTTARYSSGRLVLTATVRQLLPDVEYAAHWRLRTAMDGTWQVTLLKAPGSAATAFLFAADQVDPSLCPGLRGSANRRLDRLRISLPAVCLGTPRWVRYGLALGMQRGNVVSYDYSRVRGGRTGAPVLSPRVRYG